MKRAIVSVATGPYIRGQNRIWDCGFVDGFGRTVNGETRAENPECMFFAWADKLPPGSPTHQELNYSFKAWALKFAAESGYTRLLWVDASIVPVAALEPIWERIERTGAWVSMNGYRNIEWTADSAYPDLEVTREENAAMEHVASTAFGMDLTHPTGRYIFDEFVRLGTQTRAFHGPWKNKNNPRFADVAEDWRCSPCGPPEVSGHRHDQTALSVIAWRAGVNLTPPPYMFAYRGGETAGTILMADGKY